MTHEFDNEGNGGQSFLRYDWKPDNTYAFLLGAEPDTIHHTTTYTTYLKDISTDKGISLTVFAVRKSHLSHPPIFLPRKLYSETGDEERRGLYKNQWMMDARGKWHEIVQAKFTYDATAKGSYRKDYAGGAEGNQFYLRNDGFFNDYISLIRYLHENHQVKYLLLIWLICPNSKLFKK